MNVRTPALTVVLAGALACATGTPTPECEDTPCGCFTATDMVFTGQVMDAQTGACVANKTVILRDLDGRRVAEDRTRTGGNFRLSGKVQRSNRCPGGEPIVRDEPDTGQSLPTYDYLPRRQPEADGGTQVVDLLRVPWGAVDAGSAAPALCVLPPPDGGP